MPPEQYQTIKREVLEAFESEVRSSSLVENINSGLRQLLGTCRGQVTQELLELFAYCHNHRRFVRGKRAGKAPIEILTGKELEKTWLESLLEAAWQKVKKPVEELSAVEGCGAKSSAGADKVCFGLTNCQLLFRVYETCPLL